MAKSYTLHRKSAPRKFRIDYEGELNPQQAAAAMAEPGPALVIAGAGSGKTRTLTYRVAYLLETGIAPWQILLLTFTNKAAREMLERVAAISPDADRKIWGGTFHSIGNRILRQHTAEAGYRPHFSIMDREDQTDLMKAIIASTGIDIKGRRFPKAEVVTDILSLALNTSQTIEEVCAMKYPYFLEFTDEFAAIRADYEKRKRSINSLDFDDLLEKTCKLFREHDEVAAVYRKKFKAILVDEYQDTNRLQGEMIDLLAKDHQNVMVVGDDAQSIYSWRGADFRNIMEFPKRYPNATIYKIEQNYRSVPEVLELANAAIKANTRQFEKNLSATRPSRSFRPAVLELQDSNEQAAFVAQRVLELQDEGIDLRDMAILYRAHYHSMEVQMELTRHGIPFEITSGIRFFEQAHIKDVSAFLKFASNPRDEVAFKRVVRLLPGFGNKTAETLWQWLSAQMDVDSSTDIATLLGEAKVPPRGKQMWQQLVYTIEELAPAGNPVLPSAMITSVLEALYDEYLQAQYTNYQARRDDLQVLMNYAANYEDVGEFLSQLALQTSLDSSELTGREERDEAITLSSVHQSKGLEWQVVFVIWLTDGMFPGHRSLEDEEALEEERRLFYVAVTRAKDQLYLAHPVLRLNAGYGDMLQRPSRFLGEVPGKLMERWDIE